MLEIDDILTQQVYQEAALGCSEINMSSDALGIGGWNPNISDFLLDGLAYYSDTNNAVELLSRIEFHPDYAAIMDKLSLRDDMNVACIFGEVDSGDKPFRIPVPLQQVVHGSWGKADLVKRVCDVTPLEDVHVEVMRLAARRKILPILRQLIACLQEKQVNLASSALVETVLGVAMEDKSTEILELFLSLCDVHTVFVRGLHLLELAVIHGCKGCVGVLLDSGIDGSKLQFDGFETDHFGTWDEHAAETLAVLPHLEHFTFRVASDYNGRFLTTDLLKLLPRLVNLTSIALGLKPGFEVEAYRDVLMKLPNLEALDLSTTPLERSEYSDDPLAILSPGLVTMPHLKNLTLRQCYGYGGNSFNSLVDLLYNLTHLEYLDISDNALSIQNFEQRTIKFVNALRSLPHLRVLVVSSFCFTIHEFKTLILPEIRTFPSLEKFVFLDCPQSFQTASDKSVSLYGKVEFDCNPTKIPSLEWT